MSNFDGGDDSGFGDLVFAFLLLLIIGVIGFSLWSYFGPKYQRLQTETIQNSEAHISGVKSRISLSLESYCNGVKANNESTIATQRQMILLEAQGLSSVEQLGATGDPIRDAVDALSSGKQASCSN
jgi:predicted membrane metal-binding protein